MDYFKNRAEAGEELVRRFGDEWKVLDPVVIALPRGGISVAVPIATRLAAPLDVLVVRKIGAPSDPEFALGAVTELGTRWIDHDSVRETGGVITDLDRVTRRSVAELKRSGRVYRQGRPALKVSGRNVIIVDDGLATGSTAHAAIESLIALGVKSIVVAVPVASRESVRSLEKEQVVVRALKTPQRFHSVGQWYADFSQVTDWNVTQLLDASRERGNAVLIQSDVEMDLGAPLRGELWRPENCRGWIIFAHGTGSSRLSPRNIRVARYLNERGFGTLLFDLLTEEEALGGEGNKVFDIKLLSARLTRATRWLKTRSDWEGRPIGYFGASTGAAAALQASLELSKTVSAIVSRGGRPDLVGDTLGFVRCPVLLIVGSEDQPALDLNRQAAAQIPNAQLRIVRSAGHLFVEPGALEEVMAAAGQWFAKYLETEGSNADRAA